MPARMATPQLLTAITAPPALSAMGAPSPSDFFSSPRSKPPGRGRRRFRRRLASSRAWLSPEIGLSFSKERSKDIARMDNRPSFGDSEAPLPPQRRRISLHFDFPHAQFVARPHLKVKATALRACAEPFGERHAPAAVGAPSAPRDAGDLHFGALGDRSSRNRGEAEQQRFRLDGAQRSDVDEHLFDPDRALLLRRRNRDLDDALGQSHLVHA